MAYFECADNAALPGVLDRFLQEEGAALMVCQVDPSNNTK